ncbi:hypothetical protein SCLCIDRAFT_1165699 [Scleroderma citrinum Foug A]|uniref:Amine oxidase domain-containing protein n=1 Tax=Scleroderma citrinum Foug A TaxID=1036808 RepID=A0A0C2YPV1_9AGAM|nr:hypothetical protein SCLCIDRAFT_1165699 [Scleroderma citrinum Foug A]
MCLSRISRGIGFLSLVAGALAQANITNVGPPPNNTKVLILGGGMAGIIAARTLHEQGVDDFVVVEAKTELGGRMIPKAFGLTGRQFVVELGPSWIQGTQEGNGTANPIWLLAQKHNLSTVYNDIYGSVSFFDYNGPNNYSDTYNAALDSFEQATVLAGQRLRNNQVDMDLRSAYSLMGASPQTPQEDACEYYQVDFSPSQTSWLASAWNNNFTYVPESGGYSDANQMSIDQRGFAYIVQAEAAEFLKSNQLLLNQSVSSIHYNQTGVTVQTAGGYNLTAEHVLVTFSVGVLQNTDVVFDPPLPDWKREAVNSMEMATYTKIFLQFNETFWFPTEMGLYADQQRGKYPIWQSLDHAGFFPGSGIIFATVTGDYALYVEQLTAQELQTEVMGVLRAMYPNTTIPDPAALHVPPAWSMDELYRGAYSNYGASFVPGHADNLRATVDDRVWFAGEATSVKYFGFLQGAYIEGQDVAAYIARCVQQGGACEEIPYDSSIVNAQPYSGVLPSYA